MSAVWGKPGCRTRNFPSIWNLSVLLDFSKRFWRGLVHPVHLLEESLVAWPGLVTQLWSIHLGNHLGQELWELVECESDYGAGTFVFLQGSSPLSSHRVYFQGIGTWPILPCLGSSLGREPMTRWANGLKAAFRTATFLQCLDEPLLFFRRITKSLSAPDIPHLTQKDPEPFLLLGALRSLQQEGLLI